ncbi:AraC family transcriptional regulator [Tabrizicola sp.]|uniref:AraC family transcriptional regulator n=1 Tax=Tabrizicola sp. TaxID=2005166 RepID=UPI00286CCE11|nr:AraC family transcriptional regulator [Tabrizicola sp.]
MANDYEKRLLRVLDYIHDHPAGDLSLDALADVAAFSRFHWHRVFRAMTGETTAQTVKRMRMHRAAVALVRENTPVARIASDVGYPNTASFARAFAEIYRSSPAAFRARGELRPLNRTLKQEITLMFPVTVRSEPTRRLAAMAHSGHYFEINRSFEKLFASLSARNLVGKTGHMVGVFYNDPAQTAPADLKSHAGVEVPATLPVDPPLEVVSLPAARHAVLTFTGPYAGLPAAYDQLFAVWLPQSGEKPANLPSFEVYLNSPMDTDQDRLVTEICLPLEG